MGDRGRLWWNAQEMCAQSWPVREPSVAFPAAQSKEISRRPGVYRRRRSVRIPDKLLLQPLIEPCENVVIPHDAGHVERELGFSSR